MNIFSRNSNSNAIISKFLGEKLTPAIEVAKEEPDYLVSADGVDSATIVLGTTPYNFEVKGWRYQEPTFGKVETSWKLSSKEETRSGLLGRQRPVKELSMNFMGKREPDRDRDQGPYSYPNAVIANVSYVNRETGENFKVSVERPDVKFQHSKHFEDYLISSPANFLGQVLCTGPEPNLTGAVLRQAATAFQALEELAFSQVKVTDFVKDLDL